MSIPSLRSRSQLTATPRIRLQSRSGIPPLTMEMDRFFEFSFWIAEELLDLEARFAGQAIHDPMATNYDANGLPEDLKIDFD